MNYAEDHKWSEWQLFSLDLLWSPYRIGQTIIFLPCGFFLLSIFFPRLISAAADWMSTILRHDVALVRI